MLYRIALQTVEPATRYGQSFADIVEYSAMPWNHLPGSKRFDQIQRSAYIFERRLTRQLGKSDAKTVLPQGIRRNQCP